MQLNRADAVRRENDPPNRFLIRLTPIAVTVAVTLVVAIGAELAGGGVTDRLELQLHHALVGKPDHLAQKTGVEGLLQKLGKRDLVVGHVVGSFGLALRVATQFYPKTAPVTANQPAHPKLLAVLRQAV